jgi:hypothetical protein
MGNDVAIRDDAPAMVNVMSSEQLKYIARTEFVPTGLRGNLPAILACVATGRALGIDDMTALRSIHIIDGKATFSAELMVQLVRRRGHSITGNFSGESCTVTGKRCDNGDEMSVTWTIDMAREAGLLGKNNWKKYAPSMLWARAVSQLCRMLFADCFAGASYTDEEIGDADFDEIPESESAAVVAEEGEPEPVEPVVAESAPSAAQIKKLNVLVGTLREAGKITTKDVWDAVGCDLSPSEDGELHWSPLRDTLTKAEAHTLIEWLTAIETTPAETQTGIPLAQLVTLVNQHHVEHGLMTAAIERLFPGRSRASELSDGERGVLWAAVCPGEVANV